MDRNAPKILGALAGQDHAPGAMSAWLRWADLVIAADGGADLCRAEGREPDVIVGDLDSIADPSGLTPDDDQDSSDADKLLARLTKEGVVAATLIGVEGDRLDHVLATLYSCARSSVAEIRIALRTGHARVLRGPSRGALEGVVGGRVSLIPLGPCRLTATGLRWPLAGGWLDPLGEVSLSNRFTASRAEYEVHEGAVAVFLEGSPLPPASRASQ